MEDEFRTHVHSNGLPTEIDAFSKAIKYSSTIKTQILIELQTAGAAGLTPDEFLLMHGGLINTIRRRFTDLWKEEKIQHHPTLLARKNSSGNECVAWVLGKDLTLAQEAREKVRKPLTNEAVGLLIGNSVEEQSWLMSVVRAVERAHGIGVEDE